MLLGMPVLSAVHSAQRDDGAPFDIGRVLRVYAQGSVAHALAHAPDGVEAGDIQAVRRDLHTCLRVEYTTVAGFVALLPVADSRGGLGDHVCRFSDNGGHRGENKIFPQILQHSAYVNVRTSTIMVNQRTYKII